MKPAISPPRNRNSAATQNDSGEELPAQDTRAVSALERGRQVIAAAVKTLGPDAGVYRMLDSAGNALYVGKAKDLKKRVTSYTQIANLPRRLQRMVAATTRLEVVTTHTELEALLLESNLIKRLKPRFNVLMRDDKSFPYILITQDHDFVQIVKHRGARRIKGHYFGPFASAGAVNATVTAMERAFLLRSCSDSVFANRKRPCLLYQIKRCSAPCVGRISREDYAQLVRQARDFLAGKSQEVQKALAEMMQEASDNLDFEAASVFRDRIRAMAQIQARQGINLPEVEDADVFAIHQEGGQTCIQVFFFRNGRNYGNRAYYPQHDRQLSPAAVLRAFIPQFYDNKPISRLILTSHDIDEADLLGAALSFRAERKVTLVHPKRGAKKRLMDHAIGNARKALARRLSETASQTRLLENLAERFDLPAIPQRIEVYDNSHIQGSDAFGAMIVAGPEGFIKNAYRKFKIKGRPASGPMAAAANQQDAGAVTAEQTAMSPGDDFAMMREVFTRRFSRALREDPERKGESWPELLLVDGGRGQLSACRQVLDDLGLMDIPIAAIAKGPDRNAGRERIFLPDRAPILLEPQDPLLYFLQRLRDEAHRFVIESHRSRRAKTRLRSLLDDVPSIGPARKKALLSHFGSARAVAAAGLEDLARVSGISRTVAQRIYDHFNETS
jgi:excinuclease ABC subunit C